MARQKGARKRHEKTIRQARARMDHTAGTPVQEAWDESLSRALAAGTPGEREPAEPSGELRDGLEAGARAALDGTPAGDGIGGEAAAGDGTPAGDGTGGDGNRTALEAERTRALEVLHVCADYGLDSAGYIRSGASVSEVLQTAWNARAAEHDGQERAGLSRVSQRGDQTAGARLARGLSDAMVQRAGSVVVGQVEQYERSKMGSDFKPVDGAEFRGLRLIQMAKLCMSQSGMRVPELPDDQVAALLFRNIMESERTAFAAARGSTEALARYSRQMAGMDSGRASLDGGFGLPGGQGRDQFPNVLRDAMHRVLHATYSGDMAQRYVWRSMCEIGSASDFRPHHHTFIGGLPDMPTKNEAGEYETVKLGDGEHGSLSVVEKGFLVRITRETVVNDDLGRVMRTAGHIGVSGNRTVENLVFANLNSNSGAGDFNGSAMFVAGDRANLHTGALTDRTLHDAWVALRQQSSIGGHDYVDLMGDTVLCEDSQAAHFRVLNREDREVTGEHKGAGGPSKYDMSGKLRRILSSPRLGSKTRWYMWDSMATPFMASFLFGRDEPYFQQVETWDMSGTAFLGAIDVGVAPLSWRGMIMSTGA